MIPKIIHQIHLGKSSLSDQQKLWQKTWTDYNPNWQYILWDEDSLSTITLQNEDELDKCKNFSEKSDILRFEILYQFGGLYIDTDFECLKNIDSLFDTYRDREFIIFLETKDQIGSAFIGASKNNSYIKELVDNISVRSEIYGDSDSHIKYGPKYITDMLGLNLAIPDGKGCDQKTVYPYIWTEKNRRYEDFKITHPEAYAVHHWSYSWCKK